MSKTQTRVLIMRTRKVTIIDQTEVLVMSDGPIETFDAERKAEAYIEASSDCGHDVGWQIIETKPEAYPRPVINAGVVPAEPPSSRDD